jgi:hypothetical protein
MQLLSKVSNIVQNIFCLYGVTSFTQLWHSIPVATKCTVNLIILGSASKVAAHILLFALGGTVCLVCFGPAKQ